jgi:hypothetical protein
MKTGTTTLKKQMVTTGNTQNVELSYYCVNVENATVYIDTYTNHMYELTTI